MTNAKIDNNGIKTALGTSSTDGVTPLLMYVDPTTHGVEIDDNTTGSDLSGDIAKRDQNSEPVILGVSSSDGLTPTPIYIESAANKLLINSN